MTGKGLRWVACIALAYAAASGLRASEVQQTATASTVTPQVDALMSRFMADAAVAGVAIAVARSGEMLAHGAWGLADRQTGRPVSLETSFRLGSVSKQFTAALVMRLVERRTVNLDDRVETHYPQMPRKWRGATVQQLLNHTAGLPDYTATGERHWSKSLPPTEMLGLVSDDSLHFSPGTKYEYSNSNYMVLGLIAERHYGKPLAQILADELFTPLGLKSMRFCEDAYGSNGQSRPYVRDGERVVDAPYRSVAHSFGAGGICSTVDDVARWNRALHTGQVVNAGSYALMTTPSGAAAAAPERYGFGLGVRAMVGRSVLFHGGGVPGFITVNGWVPKENLSITVLTNTSPTVQMNAVFRDLLRVGLGRTITIVQPVENARLDEKTLRLYAGNYTIQVPGSPLDIKFFVDAGRLMSQAAGQNAAPLRPVAGEHTFGAAHDWTVRFSFIVTNGVVTGFEFEQAGAKYAGVKKR